MKGFEINDIDKGWKNIQKQVASFKKASVLVGFQKGSTTQPQVKGTREKEGGLSMPEIAFTNEFGSKRVPARPFMGPSFDENLQRINKLINIEYSAVKSGKYNAKKAFERIGLFMQGEIQLKIRSITSPPNSPATIERKGSSKPLIDFGQMIQSVTSKVELNG